jgi:hypothetical protein
MQNQDFTSTLNTHRVSETNAVIGVSKGFWSIQTSNWKENATV